MKTLTVKLEDETVEALEELAEDNKRTKSFYAREFIQDGLRRAQQDNAVRPDIASREAAFARIKARGQVLRGGGPSTAGLIREDRDR